MALYRKNSSKSISINELLSKIQKRAYEIYIKKGYKHGNDLDDWLKAEKEVKKELSIK
ncbi:MAG: DUF2934 domain-containing protein [Candidatus Omnitrophica bacterium]|nr:DUF2934 domain-containing protein [Candidatus Omnitrophota bacterium]